MAGYVIDADETPFADLVFDALELEGMLADSCLEE